MATYRDALAAGKDQIDAVPDDDIVGLNVDVPEIAAKAMTLARTPKLTAATPLE